jgi:hypothetical protein
MNATVGGGVGIFIFVVKYWMVSQGQAKLTAQRAAISVSTPNGMPPFSHEPEISSS